MALSVPPRPKRFLILSQKPFLSLFFTGTGINPTRWVFRVNDAARGNVSLKIDIYAHRSVDSRYSEDASQSEGHRTLVFFFFTFRFRFRSRKFVDQQRRLANCIVYVNVLQEYNGDLSNRIILKILVEHECMDKAFKPCIIVSRFYEIFNSVIQMFRGALILSIVWIAIQDTRYTCIAIPIFVASECIAFNHA